MIDITDILPNFSTLKEYRDFLDTLVEKSADGAEIARGMDKNDKSKSQKADTYKSKEVKKHANGGATETHYDQVDQSLEQPPEEPVEPPQPLQPGQQVKIGNKIVDPTAQNPKTIEIKTTGGKSTVNTKPRIDLFSIKNKPL